MVDITKNTVPGDFKNLLYLAGTQLQDRETCLTALLTKDNQFGLQRLEVDYVEGTSKHSQGNQQHGRADTEEKKHQ